MNLQKLIQILPIKKVVNPKEIEITTLEMDSRMVSQGALFFCVPGYTVDGHQFVQKAMEQGAVAFVASKPIDAGDSPVIYVQDVKRAMAVLSDRFYGHPTQKLKLIGITGTNGKTTTSQLIDQIFLHAGKKTGLIGTMFMKIDDQVYTTTNTTPESIVLQKKMADMVNASVEVCTMEVSSHALELGRVHGCDFDIAVFTNLTQDHLDFHATMENYQFAKSLLFSQLGNVFYEDRQKFAILNADDSATSLFRKVTAAHTLTYGVYVDADFRAKHITYASNGTTFTLETKQGSFLVQSKLIGEFNVYNLLAAICTVYVYGLPLDEILQAVLQVKGVRGRFELVDHPFDFSVIVDYAHTPDGLENVLKTAREITDGRTIVVIGCGGNRDVTKRPIMANVAVTEADYAIFTSDNPRNENPLDILADMQAGVSTENYTCIVEREVAIEKALKIAQKNDRIIIAGKGHETTQTFKNEKIHFDDVEVARAILEKLYRSKG